MATTHDDGCPRKARTHAGLYGLPLTGAQPQLCLCMAAYGAAQARSALSTAERQVILGTMTTDAFKDQPPVAIYHQLLQDGIYLASVSTMHRLLRADKLNGERRHQRAPQHHAVPRLLAHAPNEV